MEWLVGMDLTDRGQGALGYARWLAGVLPPKRDHFIGVHVLEESELLQLLRHHHLEEVEGRAASAAKRVVAQAGAEAVLAELRVLCGRSAEQTLQELARYPGGSALVIGRQARRGEKRVVRLGRVARRLLRSLPGPVVVVPPDLQPNAVGDGPVLLAASTDADATGAAKFAKRIAADLGRPLSVVHVVPGDDYLAAELIPVGVANDYFRERREDHERRLLAWMRAHGLGGVPHLMSEGSVVDRLADVAREERSPLVVTGSRGLGLGGRLFSSSVATDLAGASEVPVAVVPNNGG
jgi:nucleotide-binding universal stress UspA family protein